MSFSAKWGGACAECPARIVPGDQVLYDAEGNLVHENCEPGLPEISRQEPYCNKCFLFHAGECM